MGLELPGALTEPLGWIGMIWPQADEEKLFQDGATWISYADIWRGQAAQAQASAQQVWTVNHGDSIDAFRTWWSGPDGPGSQLASKAVACELIGAGLIVMATITLALKLAFVVQLVLLAIEVAQAIATAFVSFGATTAEIPGFIAAGRVICRELLDRVISMIEKEIAELFEKAASLLEKAGAKDLSQGAERTAEKLTGKAQERMFDSLFSKAGRVDVSTERDAAIFYSGEDGAGRRMFDYAQQEADTSGRKILETTSGGRAFDDMHLYDDGSPITGEQADQIWKRLSSRYGQGASGDVEAMLHQGNDYPLSNRIFMTREIKALEENPSVGSVTIRDPTTGAARSYSKAELKALNGDYSSIMPAGSK